MLYIPNVQVWDHVRQISPGTIRGALPRAWHDPAGATHRKFLGSPFQRDTQRTDVGTLSELQQEMKRYEACPNPGRDADILSFWKLYETQFPHLARIAKIVLAIPASSSKSERVFSTGGLVVSSLRFHLLSLVNP